MTEVTDVSDGRHKGGTPNALLGADHSLQGWQVANDKC
jgi:hypothetical protein